MGLILAAIISCAVASPGCEFPVEPTPDPVPAVSQFAVSYTRSGGLKAESTGLQIEPGRHATLRARGAIVRFRVATKKVRRLRAALEDANWGAPGPPESSPGTCADCYQYTIRYRGLIAVFDQSIQTHRFDRAVEQLEALVQSHLPFH
jgi:hypothetical protein